VKKLLIALLCTLALAPALALGAEDEMSNYDLFERIKHLESQLKTTTMSKISAAEVTPEPHADKKLGALLSNWSERITLRGLVEIEAAYENINFDKGGKNASSDLTLATVELEIDAELTDTVYAHILLLWEEDETEPIEIDEAFILLDGIADTPVWIKAGRMYVPFGNLTSYMITDPLTLEIGETRASAVAAGFNLGGAYALAYAFNGDIDKAGKDSHIDNFGAQIGYIVAHEGFNLDAGISYINNLIESDSWGDEFEDFGGYELKDYIGGFGAHAVIEVGDFNFIAEFICALDKPKYIDAETGAVEKRDAVKVWNLEAGYSFDFLGKDAIVALAYQGTHDADSMLPQGYGAEDDELAFLPEQRYMAAVGAEIFPYTSLKLEYMHDEYKKDDRSDTITMQLAFEF